MAKWIKYQIVCNEEKNILLNKKLEYSEANLVIAQNEAYGKVYEIVQDDKVIDKEPLAIEHGGTNAKTAAEARKNLGVVEVETYTDGIWTCRIWSDGIKECWGRYSKKVSLTPVSAVPGLVVYSSAIRGTYPDNLFTEAPVCQATVNKIVSSDGETHYNAWAYTRDPSTTSRTVGVGLLRLGSEISNVTVEIGFYSIGR